VPPLFWGWPSSWLLLQLVLVNHRGSLLLAWQVSWHQPGSWLQQMLQVFC
jgi:hypothetical protein